MKKSFTNPTPLISRPLISIITPILNGEKYLENAIKSILDQNYFSFEHIVIDGGSTDKTLKIIQKYPFIRVFVLPGLSQAESLNVGIKLARGKIITSLNDDDFYQPQTFRKVTQLFFKNRDAMVIVGNCNVVSASGSNIEVGKPSLKYHQILQPWKYDFPKNPSSYFYKKTVHEEIGFYDESKSYDYVFDYEFLVRLSKKYEFLYTNETLGNFRFYSGTKTYNNQGHGLSAVIEVAHKFHGSCWHPWFYYYKFSYLKYLMSNKLEKILSENNTFIIYLRTKIKLRTRLKKIFSILSANE